MLAGSPMPATSFRAFAACSPGLETMLQDELSRIGARGVAEGGGVEFGGPRELLWRAHRESRLAESIRVRLKAFPARTFAELEQGLTRLPWHAYVALGTWKAGKIQIAVTCRRSRLYHSDAVSERVRRVLTARLDAVRRVPEPREEDRSAGRTRIFVRLLRDQVQVSIDASGDRLHRRGYRIHVVRAPLRETLASALAMLLERRSEGAATPVWDPFCGSGTLLCEWLTLRHGVAPGARRRFAFEDWPIHDADAYARWLSEQRRGECSGGVLEALGSDVSGPAIAAAVSNAERAGLGGCCRLWAEDFRVAAERVPPGARILTNPPYGVRVARGKSHGILEAFDELVERRADLRPIVLLCGDPNYPVRSRLPWRQELAFRSGGLRVRALSLTT